MNMITRYVCAFLLAVLCAGCSSDVEVEQNAVMHTYRMLFDGGIVPYEASRAAVDVSVGEEMLIGFSDGSYGTARQIAAGTWSLSYAGNPKNMNGRCNVYWFEGATNNSSAGTSEIRYPLSYANPVYQGNGSCAIDNDGNIVITATLSPLFARVRFVGESGTTLNVQGVQHAQSFSTIHSFSYTDDGINLTVGSNGSTDYIYYHQPSSDVLTLTVNGKNTYTIANPLRKDAASGFIDVPTGSSHQGWTEIN